MQMKKMYKISINFKMRKEMTLSSKLNKYVHKKYFFLSSENLTFQQIKN